MVPTGSTRCKTPFDPNGASSCLLQKQIVSYQGQTVLLEGYGVAGILFDHGSADLAEYHSPDPLPSKECLKYEEELQYQKDLRENPPLGSFIQVMVPPMRVAYEKSMVDDLYDNRLELLLIKNGVYERLGWIGKNGFQNQATSRNELIGPGQKSAWIDLNEILGPGRHQLAVRSMHLGELYYSDMPFYSFITVRLTAAPESGHYREIIFRNELEPDRSLLHFTITRI